MIYIAALLICVVGMTAAFYFGFRCGKSVEQTGTLPAVAKKARKLSVEERRELQTAQNIDNYGTDAAQEEIK